MINEQLLIELKQYIDEHYIEEPIQVFIGSRSIPKGRKTKTDVDYEPLICANCIDEDSLAQRIKDIDESFSKTLFRLIDEKGMSDVQCYNKAQIDRKLFSKIRSDKYHVSKNTAIALCLALELQKEECDNLLMKAGYAFSDNNKTDVIISFFIEKGIYDINTIDEVLLKNDQKTLTNY